MKNILAATSAFALLASAVYAGGPVVVEEEDEVIVEEQQAGSSAWVPLLMLAVIGLAVASGDESERPLTTQ